VFKISSHILLVDDEKDFVEMLSLRLKENGEDVLAVHSGQACLETLEKESIDVIILHVKMPGMDGIETLKKIKKLHPLVEVIMLTGHGTIQSAVEGMKLGAFDFLLKPADFKALTEKLNKAKERRKEQMERIQKAEAAILLRQSKI
jgi:DNA-binding NtrC family response regulator